MSLTAAIGLALGALDLDVDLEVDETAVVAVVEPNGAGKDHLGAGAGRAGADRPGAHRRG